MEIRFDTLEGKAKINKKDGKIRLSMEKQGDIYKKINEELEKGFLDIKPFKNSGVPGKVKTLREYESVEDVITLLRSFRQGFRAINIVSINFLEDKEYNIIEIDELRFKKMIQEESLVREYENIYEYCPAGAYEKEYMDYTHHIVQFSEVFIKFVEIENDREILSICFPKDIFRIGKLTSWIKYNEIRSFDNSVKYVEDTEKILEGVNFQEGTILLYGKGTRDLPIDRSQLVQIRDNLYEGEKGRKVYYGQKMQHHKTEMDIVLYGEKINYIPEIELLSGEVIFCNDLLIEAEYIGNYKNHIGFFKDRTYKEPIAWIVDKDERIEIRDEHIDDAGIMIVEYGKQLRVKS